MPFTFLAHQAPVLPLKLWRPRWFSGAGLAIGSMAPDFDKFIDGADATRYGHTLLGQVVYCLPLSIGIYWLLVRVAAPTLARVGPDLGPLRLRDYAVALAAAPALRQRWPSLVASILVGSVSHVAFDGFTHADPRVVALFPILRARTVTLGAADYWSPALFQLLATALGTVVTLALMLALSARRQPLAWAGIDPSRADAHARTPAPAARRFWLATAALALAAGAAFVGLHLAVYGWRPPRQLAYSLALRLPLIGFAAVCLASLLAGPRDRVQSSAARRPDARSRPSTRTR